MRVSSPSWTDNTGDAITGTVGIAIANVTVPAVDAGTPDPTYAAEGSLPAGVSFDPTTRVLSFTTADIEAGSGTITIRATNSAGMDDWTVAYTFVAPDAVAPTAVITSPSEIDERVTLAQFASVAVDGGTYDTLAYGWSDGGAGGTVGASGSNVFYAPPDVSVLTSVTLTCVITAAGTGTNAKSGTSATVTATRTIMVRPGAGNDQVFALPGSTHTETSLTHRWEFPNGERPPLINALKTNDSDARFLAGIVIGNNNFVELLFAANQTESAALRNDLSDTFETNGSFTLVADGRTLALDLDSQDATEPYRWQPSPTTPVSSFRTGVGSGDGVAGVLTLDTGIRPDAVAPTVTIGAVTEVDEDDTLALSASVSGGTYDSIAYAWSVDSGGGSITGSGASVTYNPPDVSSNTAVAVRCTVTATGDGTLAADGTSDTGSDTESFTVRQVLPDATAPTTFAITAVDGVDEDETLTLTVTHSGGVYDTIDYIWQILFSGGGTITGSGTTVTYNPPDVSADTEITVAVTGTARGSGTLAADGTSQSTNDQEVFTVRRVVLLTLADIAVPDGRMLVGTGSLIEAGANEPYGDSSTVLDGDDPPDLGSDDLNPTRMWMASGTPGTRWRISDNGAGNIEAIFSAGGALEDYQVHIQPSFTDVVSLARDAINATPSTAARILWDMPDAEEALLNAIGDGDRWIFFLTQPAVASISVTPGTISLGALEGSTQVNIRNAAVAARTGIVQTGALESSAQVNSRDAAVDVRIGTIATNALEGSARTGPINQTINARIGAVATGALRGSASAGSENSTPVSTRTGTVGTGFLEGSASAVPSNPATDAQIGTVETGALEGSARVNSVSLNPINVQIGTRETGALEGFLNASLTDSAIDVQIGTIETGGLEGFTNVDPSNPTVDIQIGTVETGALEGFTRTNPISLTSVNSQIGTVETGALEGSINTNPKSIIPTIAFTIAQAGTISLGSLGGFAEAEPANLISRQASFGTIVLGELTGSLRAIHITKIPVSAQMGLVGLGSLEGQLNSPPRDSITPWPTTLPQKFLRDGFQQSLGDNVLPFPVTRGRPMRRKRFTRISKPITGSMVLTSAQWDILLNFYFNTLQGGQLAFEMPKPVGSGSVDLEFLSHPPNRISFGVNWRVDMRFRVAI